MEENFVKLLGQLTKASIEGDYNPHTRFQWPESLADDQWWMAPELLTVYGTPYMETLTERQLQHLSKWESINFYSLNIHGIRELLIEIARRLHVPGFEIPAEFFHRFLAEENDHMWFFAQFCLRYGKIYPDRTLKLPGEETNPDLASFYVFARINIFEEIVDHFNMKNGNDSSLHPFIRQINSVHHEDESRHISGGRKVVKVLFAKLKETLGPEQLAGVEAYLKNFIRASIESLYVPAAYADAGIPEPYKLRNELLKSPARREHHRKFSHRSVSFLNHIGAISEQGYVP